MSQPSDKGRRGPHSLSLHALILLLCVVTLDSTSQLMLKSAVERASTAVMLAVIPGQEDATSALIGEMLTEPRLWIATGLLCVNFLIWARALMLVDLSIAVPVINLSYAIVPVGAWLFLREDISPQRWAGVVLIFTGVMICSLTRNRPPLPPPTHPPRT